MDNSNNLSNLQSMETTSGNISGFATEQSNSFFDWLKSISLFTWFIIIMVFAFLGINIFAYLSQGTQNVADIFKPLVDSIVTIFAKITGQTVNVAAEGAKGVVNTSANVLDAGLSELQELSQGQLPSASTAATTNATTSVQSTIPQPDVSQSNSLNKALNTYASKKQGEDSQMFQADDATSSIQGAGQAGWCYIGEEKGYRSCAEVGVNDSCMSGEIFPTQEICINPSLRA